MAVSLEKKTAYEILVDLNAKKIESIKDLENLQPSLMDSEFDKAKDIVDASPAARAALEKRGYQIKGKISDTFFLDTYAPGKNPLLVKKGKTIRAVRVLFADRQGGTNNYGPYVEGLMALDASRKDCGEFRARGFLPKITGSWLRPYREGRASVCRTSMMSSAAWGAC